MNLFAVNWNEDSDATVLARVTARGGTGAATGIDGEGNFLKIADVSTIKRHVFDLGGATPDVGVETTVVVATAILDIPVIAQTIWTKDTTGYNFLDDVGAANFPTGGNIYRIEYVFTLVGGIVFHGFFEGPAELVKVS